VGKKLSGYWIPEKIPWKSPKTSIPEIDRNTLIADFGILCIDSSSKIDFIYSTQTKIKGSDSIGVEYEPGMELWEGDSRNENDNRIIVKFTPIPDESGQFHTSDKAQTDTMEIIADQNESYLIFRNRRYRKTTKYDFFSVHKIEAFRHIKY
jgi:hypothetical protein